MMLIGVRRLGLRRTSGAFSLVLMGAMLSCRPSDILSVPAPLGVVASGALQNQAGAESVFNGAKGQLFNAADGAFISGLLVWSELLTDEFTFSGFTYYAPYAPGDARVTAGGAQGASSAWQNLLRARLSLALVLPSLVANEPTSGRSKVGEAYALMAYSELLMAESFCGGTALNAILPGGGLQYGIPLSTDSLLAVAETHFDSAIAESHGNDTVAGLASVGLGRTLLDRGQYAAAATAVNGVPTSYVYDAVLEPGGYSDAGAPYTFGVYDDAYNNDDQFFNVADREGGNGLNFVSAHDPRLVLDSSMLTLDGGTWYFPTKFATNFAAIPLATGIEARLIEAEAALQGNQPTLWATDLASLREDSADTHVTFDTSEAPIKADSTTGADPAAQVDLMFRERAFWLFGTGTRLGDLRRLIRQYGRDESTVFPIGVYPNGHNTRLPVPIPNYGTDVNLTLPTSASEVVTITNPNYKGCITSTKTA